MRVDNICAFHPSSTMKLIRRVHPICQDAKRRRPSMSLLEEFDIWPWNLEHTWSTGCLLDRNLENIRGEVTSCLSEEWKLGDLFKVSLCPRVCSVFRGISAFQEWDMSLGEERSGLQLFWPLSKMIKWWCLSKSMPLWILRD